MFLFRGRQLGKQISRPARFAAMPPDCALQCSEEKQTKKSREDKQSKEKQRRKAEEEKQTPYLLRKRFDAIQAGQEKSGEKQTEKSRRRRAEKSRHPTF